MRPWPSLQAILSILLGNKEPAHVLHLHAHLFKYGLQTHSSLGEHLVSTLAEAGLLHKAQQSFDLLHQPNSLSQNAIIAGYVKHGMPEPAINFYDRLQHGNATKFCGHTLVNLIKACRTLKDVKRGVHVHAEASRFGLLISDPFVGSALVDMYSSCGFLEKAQQVFDELTIADVVSWNALMTAYVNHGHGKEALRIFNKMQEKGISPDVISFVCSLKACGSIGSNEKAEEIRAEVERKGLIDSNVHIGSAVVDMYVKFGALCKAQAVFDKLPSRNLVTWNILIAGYAEHGLGAEAFKYLKLMQLEGFDPNAITLVCVIKGCMVMGAFDKCQVLHAELARKGLVARNAFVGTSLVDMYAKHGWLAKAQEVFNELPARNTVLWTTLIAGYTDQACGEEALICYDEMLNEGIFMDSTVLTCCLKACGSIFNVEKGKEIHAEIERRGLVKGDITLANALVDMYAKCGFLEQAQEVFDHLCIRNVVSWTSLVGGYLECGFFEEAVEKLKLMQGDGVSPNAVTLLCGLKACRNLGATMEGGHEIHEEVERKGLEMDLVMGNTLVDMYSKCGLVSRARTVLESLKIRDVVSWNALILGYAEQGYSEEALKCLEEMQAQGVSPDAVTFIGSLKACCSMGAEDKGQELHVELARNGLLEGSIIVGSTLVDMYAKCGLLGLAEQVFDELPIQDVVSWNSLIGGYAQLGETHQVFKVFNKMHGECVEPDLVTFLIVLHSCSGTGLSRESGTYFETMSNQYGVIPTLEHHSCVVDLHSRVGNLDKATAMLAKMPFCPNLVLWNTVLSACRNWGNVELGRQAFQNAVRLDKQDGAANACRWEHLKEWR